MTTLYVIIGFLVLGAVVNFAAFIWTCVVARRHTAWWILAFILVPVVEGVAARVLIGPAMMTSALWVSFLLALPLARLAFAGRHWADAWKPLALTAVGMALVWVPLGLYRDQLVPLALQAARARGAASGPRGAAVRPPGPAPQAAPVASEAMQRETALAAETEQRQRRAQEARAAYEKHRAEADALYKDLNARRTKLKVDDAAAVAAFNAEAARYATLLDQMKAEWTAASDPAGAAAPPVAAAAATPAATTVAAVATKPPAAAAAVGNRGDPRAAAVAVTPAPESANSLPKRLIDKARAARDAAASEAGNAGALAAGAHGRGAAEPSPAAGARR